jgi:hypothetical protein
MPSSREQQPEQRKPTRLNHHDPEYVAIHYWVRKQFGDPMQCEECGTTEKPRYEWANVSNQYIKDRSDWKRLCVPCHRLLDLTKPFCSKGHPFFGENLAIRPNGRRRCRTCSNDANKQWRADIARKAKIEVLTELLDPESEHQPDTQNHAECNLSCHAITHLLDQRELQKKLAELEEAA